MTAHLELYRLLEQTTYNAFVRSGANGIFFFSGVLFNRFCVSVGEETPILGNILSLSLTAPSDSGAPHQAV